MAHNSDEYNKFASYVEQRVIPNIPHHENQRQLRHWILANQNQFIKHPSKGTANFVLNLAKQDGLDKLELQERVNEWGEVVVFRANWKHELTLAQYRQRQKAWQKSAKSRNKK